MQPTREINFRAPRNTTFRRVLTLKADGVPMDLTGYTATFVVTPTAAGSAAAVSLAAGSGITMGGAAGTITVVIAKATMATLPVGTYRFRVKLIAPDTSDDRVMAGGFTVTDEDEL